MKEVWKWEMIADLYEYYVRASNYVIDEADEEEPQETYDSFETRIVSDPKLEDFYKALEYAENLYCRLQNFLPNSEDVLYMYMCVEKNVHGKLLTKSKSCKVSLEMSEKYSDFLLRNVNEFFKQSLPELLKSNVKKTKIYASIYRKRKVNIDEHEEYSDSIYEYILLEIILKLRMKEEVI